MIDHHSEYDSMRVIQNSKMQNPCEWFHDTMCMGAPEWIVAGSTKGYHTAYHAFGASSQVLRVYWGQ